MRTPPKKRSLFAPTESWFPIQPSVRDLAARAGLGVCETSGTDGFVVEAARVLRAAGIALSVPKIEARIRIRASDGLEAVHICSPLTVTVTLNGPQVRLYHAIHSKCRRSGSHSQVHTRRTVSSDEPPQSRGRYPCPIVTM